MTDASMKARVRNLTRQTGLSPQIVLQMHLLERLLERFSKSRYAENIVLKGGMLIASMAGIRERCHTPIRPSLEATIYPSSPTRPRRFWQRSSRPSSGAASSTDAPGISTM